MRRLALAVLGLVAGYAAGALVGLALVAAFSGNTHDKSVEMAMTAIFVAGPIGAILGAVAALALSRRAAR
ncbi:MAG: hypothetical protein NW223_16280 [Hyphomicrobiaceae bacterium]|nr:hypothetical protein [Hyphomicrobiaceae bacterium]